MAYSVMQIDKMQSVYIDCWL